MEGAPNYTINPAWMDRVQQVVDWSLEEGLYVMINVHHDSWMWVSKMPTDHDAVLAQFNAIWTQVADRFKNHSDKLMFESINEQAFGRRRQCNPHFSPESSTLPSFILSGTVGGNNDVVRSCCQHYITGADPES